MSIISSSLVESTINALQAHLTSLEKEKAAIDNKMVEINEAIRQWRATLRTLDNNSSAKDTISRKKRGDNPRVIQEWFLNHPGQSFSIPEVAKETGLQNGSVHNVVVKGKERNMYEKDAEGKWKIRLPVNELKNGTSAINE